MSNLRRSYLCVKKSRATFELAMAIGRFSGVGVFHDSERIWLVSDERSQIKKVRTEFKAWRSNLIALAKGRSKSYFAGACQRVATEFYSRTTFGLPFHVAAYLTRNAARSTRTNQLRHDVSFVDGMAAAASLL